jgi:hypothetical protein
MACQRVFYAQAWTTYKQKLWAWVTENGEAYAI